MRLFTVYGEPAPPPGTHRVPLEEQQALLVVPIPSDSTPGLVYPVRQLWDGRWYCPCADFEYRGAERQCKHILRAIRKVAIPAGPAVR